jgi:hypothetical protein
MLGDHGVAATPDHQLPVGPRKSSRGSYSTALQRWILNILTIFFNRVAKPGAYPAP